MSISRSRREASIDRISIVTVLENLSILGAYVYTGCDRSIQKNYRDPSTCAVYLDSPAETYSQ